MSEPPGIEAIVMEQHRLYLYCPNKGPSSEHHYTAPTKCRGYFCIEKATELLARNLGLLKEQISLEGGTGEMSVFERERIKEFSDKELAVFTASISSVGGSVSRSLRARSARPWCW